MKRSSLKMVFFALNYPVAGYVCMPAVLLFLQDKGCQWSRLISPIWAEFYIERKEKIMSIYVEILILFVQSLILFV